MRQFTLTEKEADVVQFMVWYFSQGKVPGYERGFYLEKLTLSELRKLWQKIIQTERKHET